MAKALIVVPLKRIPRRNTKHLRNPKETQEEGCQVAKEILAEDSNLED